MFKYLKSFSDHSEYEEYINGRNVILPNVSICNEEDDLHYNPIMDYSTDYLTFDIVTDGTIVWKAKNANTPTATISYKLNDGEWTEITSSIAGATLNVVTGDKVMFKGDNTNYAVTSSDYNTFNGGTAEFDVKGNIMSLIYGDDFVDETTLESDYTFAGLFAETNILKADGLALPATTLTTGCYHGMFMNSTSLITPPRILPATTLADACYWNMFANCRSMISAPKLPATTLAYGCYEYMFHSCISLIKAPKLPATTLARGCYFYMFRDCRNLTEAPVLPATTLTQNCYTSMFEFCPKINFIKCLATDISADGCTADWLSGVSPTGTFIKAESMEDWTTDRYGIPSGWTVENASE